MKTLTSSDLKSAVETLSSSQRGRRVLANLLAFIQEGGDGLDSVNQDAVLMVLRCQFGPFAGSTREEIKKAIGSKGNRLQLVGDALNAAESFVENSSGGGSASLLADLRKAQAAL